MTTKKARYPEVRVRWVDSRQADATWQPLDEVLDNLPKPCMCETTAWLIYSDNNKVVLASCLVFEENNDQIAGVMVIPKQAVIHVQTLVDAEAVKFKRQDPPLTGYKKAAEQMIQDLDQMRDDAARLEGREQLRAAPDLDKTLPMGDADAR